MGKQHKGLTALFAALTLAGSCGLFSASALAAKPDYVMPEQGAMELSIGRDGLAPVRAVAGKSFIMRTGNIALKRISVSDPTVLDYSLLSPSELYLLPKRYGSTNITLWTKDQPADKMYAGTELWLESPKLGVKMSIAGVPQTKVGWDVT